MMDAITWPMVVTGITIFGIIASYLHSKSTAAKEQNDQFHQRINQNVAANHETALKVAKLEGYQDGRQVGRNEILQELSLKDGK